MSVQPKNPSETDVLDEKFNRMYKWAKMVEEALPDMKLDHYGVLAPTEWFSEPGDVNTRHVMVDRVELWLWSVYSLLTLRQQQNAMQHIETSLGVTQREKMVDWLKAQKICFAYADRVYSFILKELHEVYAPPSYMALHALATAANSLKQVGDDELVNGENGRVLRYASVVAGLSVVCFGQYVNPFKVRTSYHSQFELGALMTRSIIEAADREDVINQYQKVSIHG